MLSQGEILIEDLPDATKEWGPLDLDVQYVAILQSSCFLTFVSICCLSQTHTFTSVCVQIWNYFRAFKRNRTFALTAWLQTCIPQASLVCFLSVSCLSACVIPGIALRTFLGIFHPISKCLLNPFLLYLYRVEVVFFFHFDHFTDGRTPWTSDPLPKHRTNTYTYQTSMPCVGFEPMIPASERAKTVP
jgi:hypothetical protein